MKYFMLSILQISLLCSCANYKGNFTTQTKTTPLNVDRSKGKWLIDDPILVQIHPSYETIIANYYIELLNKKFTTLRSVKEIDNFSSLNVLLKNNIEILDLYHEGTNFDYLIGTELIYKPDNVYLTKMLTVKPVT